jgi:peptidoglycan/xylan/chitin deacetylase (PgdA/CDA1 family)
MSNNALMKTLAVNLLDITGIGRLLRPFYGGRGAILSFHSVLPDDVPGLQPGNVVRVTQLREALQYLIRSGFELIPLDEVPERLSRNSGVSSRFIAITMDDGYADNVLHGLPLFKEFRAPFTIFATTGFLNRNRVDCPIVLAALLLHSDKIVLEHPSRGVLEYSCRTQDEKLAAFRLIRSGWSRCDLEQSLVAACDARCLSVSEILDRTFLSWEQLRTLSRDPLATIGVHTVSHRRLAVLTEEQAANEISTAQQELETRLGVRMRHIAYPYGSTGDCGEREFQLARDMGFLTGCTTSRGNLHARHRHALWSLPRHTISMVRHSANVRYLRLSLSGVWDSPLNGTIVCR